MKVQEDCNALRIHREKLLNDKSEGTEFPKSVLLLKVPQVTKVTGLGRSTVYAAIATGELPAIRLGKAIRVPLSALEAWIEAKLRANQESEQ